MIDNSGTWPTWNDIKNDIKDGIKQTIDWVDNNIIEPAKKFTNKAKKAFSSENARQELTDILINNVSATGGISLGFALQTSIENCGVDLAQRMDIISFELRNGEFDIGHSGKAASVVEIGPFSIGPRSDVFESSIDGERRVYDDTYFDIGFSHARSEVFLIGYQYEISISYLGIIKDILAYINTF